MLSNMGSTVFGCVFLSVVLVGAAAAGLLREMPRRCAGHKYCTEPDDRYPQQLIDKLLTQYKVSLGHPHEIKVFSYSSTNSRYQNDCQHTVSYSSIFEIEDQDGNVRIVVQSKNFTQQVRIEKCLFPGQLKHRTEHFSDEDVKYHNISCHQQTAAYSFLALSRDGAGLESVSSQPVIPVFCACRLN